MGRLRRLRGREVVAALKRAGFVVLRVRGSHHFLRHSDGRATVVPKNGFYEFTKDAAFSSPSAAAAVVEGGSANGLMEWRTKDGRVLKELDEQA